MGFRCGFQFGLEKLYRAHPCLKNLLPVNFVLDKTSNKISTKFNQLAKVGENGSLD
jgi:hypothetical protein